MPGTADPTPATYNFHGLFGVEVAHRGLEAQMRRELGVFVGEVEAVDLRVEEAPVALPERVLSGGYAYDEAGLVVETPSGRIRLGQARLRAGAVDAFELLRWVKYFMRDGVLEREAVFLHAAAVARDGVGYLFPAWGHTGKTNLTLEFLREGYDFLSDDWSFVTAEGEVLAYPRHLALFDRNFRCHPFLAGALPTPRDRRVLRRQLGALRVARTLGTSTGATRRFGRWLRGRAHVSERMPVSQAFPEAQVAMRSPLTRVCLLTNVRSGGDAVSEVPPARLARRVALFGQYERSRFYEAQVAMAAAGLGELEDDVLASETAILTRAFQRARCLEVTIPEAQDAGVVERIRRRVEAA